MPQLGIGATCQECSVRNMGVDLGKPKQPKARSYKVELPSYGAHNKNEKIPNQRQFRTFKIGPRALLMVYAQFLKKPKIDSMDLTKVNRRPMMTKVNINTLHKVVMNASIEFVPSGGS